MDKTKRYNVTFQIQLEAKTEDAPYIYSSHATDFVRKAIEHYLAAGFQPEPGIEVTEYHSQGTSDADEEARNRFDRSTYYDEVNSIAKEIVDEGVEGEKLSEVDFDRLRSDVIERAAEYVDGHQWIIYTRYNLKVLEFSDNEAAAEDVGIELDLRNGVAGLHSVLAYFAMRRDVEEAIESYLSELEEKAEYEEDDEDESEEV